MTPDPWPALTDGRPSIGSLTEPLLVDPDARLLADVVEAFGETEPALVDPDLEALSTANTPSDGSSGPSALSGGSIPERVVESVTEGAPLLTVLADDDVVDAVVHGFHAASRLAALTETGFLELYTLREPQPAVVLAGEETGCVLLESHDANDAETDDAVKRCRVGDDPSLHGRYAGVVADAPARRLRTPSRHRVYRAFLERCGVPVAADVIRLLDADPGLTWEDRIDPRLRAYVVGARHGVLDHDLRRACEDAGLGSPSTFTRVKRRLIDAELVETERVPRPIGRPRTRIVAADGLADPPVSAVAETLRSALAEG